MKETTHEQDQVQIKIQRIYLKDASFESNGPFNTADWKPHLDVELNTKSKKLDDPGAYEVILRITITAKQKEKRAFLVEVQQAGIFFIPEDNKQQTEPIIYAQCPNILFPFVRETVASLVSKGGFPQLLLGPMNFEAIYKQKHKAISEQESINVTH